jgi:cystathionine beta-lyase/cystathionine gamma-synthase
MQESARVLASRLMLHPAVARVHHASLPGTDADGLVGRQMDGPGSMVAFELVAGFDAAREVLESVQIATHAVSLGSTDTLVQHPASLTHRVVAADSRESSGVGASLLRISVGLEDVDDIWRDLLVGLDRAAKLGRHRTSLPELDAVVIHEAASVEHA